VADALGVAKQRLGVSQQVVADGHRLRALKMRVAGHHPTGMRPSLPGERLDHVPDGGDELRSSNAAVKPQVQRNLVVARAPCVQRSPGRRDFREPAFDGGMDVLIGVLEFELVRVELALHAAEATLDRREPAFGKKARRSQPARVSEAGGDGKRVLLFAFAVP
jgi:hypothetical protein